MTDKKIAVYIEFTPDEWRTTCRKAGLNDKAAAAQTKQNVIRLALGLLLKQHGGKREGAGRKAKDDTT